MELSDAEIIRASLDDPEMFGVGFERYFETIFRYVARRQGLDRVEDLTAEVFTRAFELRSRYDASREVCRPWLYGIASNIIGDEIRRQRRTERLYLALVGLGVETEDPYARSEDEIVAHQQVQLLNQSLDRSRPGDRDVLLLCVIEELSYQEIADALGIPIGTVRSRLARARRKTRELEAHLSQTIGEEQRKEL